MMGDFGFALGGGDWGFTDVYFTNTGVADDSDSLP